MTSEAHNRYVALAHLAYGISNTALIVLVCALMFGRGFWDREDLILTSVGLAVVGFLNVVFTLPSFVAAWALLKRKPWAKMAAIIAGAVGRCIFRLARRSLLTPTGFSSASLAERSTISWPINRSERWQSRQVWRSQAETGLAAVSARLAVILRLERIHSD